ncbi:hypothetical protein E8E13_001340 [Curvularia kusanoi]|uniref:Heterokaryon incompatibility domain-containing protein n=1 Tax=Curvularia kusanoi TaxID=90978 RepID=A0A9P4TE19_CURKU|nr:hypothetical protein E8E13_001340 [Curvularia kusanoi]
MYRNCVSFRYSTAPTKTILYSSAVIGYPSDMRIPVWLKQTTPNAPWDLDIDRSASTALSYVRGHTEPKCVAWITDGDQYGWMTIPTDLDSFLKTFRCDSDSAFTWFWIDQISISQQDNREKGNQVSLLSEIYTLATDVEVWLAPEAPIGSKKAIVWITKVSEMTNFGVPRRWRGEEHFIMDGLVEHYKVLLDIIQLPCWSRLWVVQEVVLGHRAKIRLGDMVTLCRPLRAGLRIFVNEMKIFENLPRTRSYVQAISDMGEKKWLETLPIQSHLQSTTAPFYHWIDVAASANGKGCQDVRDKAFGMLGLIQGPLRFVPDYTMEPQEIVMTILRKELEYSVMLGEKNLFDRPGLGTLAQVWSVLLQSPQHKTFDFAEIRNFLLHEAHPALCAIPLNPSLDQAATRRALYAIWFTTHCIGSGPKWVAA